MSEGIMSKRWFKWTVSIVIVLAVLVAAAVVWHLWGKPKVEDTAQAKAKQVFDLARESGLLENVKDEAAFVDDLVQVYGEDGGYAVQVAESSLREAALLYTSAVTGEVVQRPSLAQAKHILYSLIVMKVYQPVLYEEKILPFIDGLNVQDDSKYPQWLKDDLGWKAS